jgi:hypothetical protein
VKLVDRAISIEAAKPATESSVAVSGLSRVSGLRASAKMKFENLAIKQLLKQYNEQTHSSRVVPTFQ